MKDHSIFDLRAQAIHLISHTTQYESNDPKVAEALAQFQSLQDAIRKSTAALIPPPAPLPKPTVSPAPPAPIAAVRFGTEQPQYEKALADEDVIRALLQLHDEAEIENRVARNTQKRLVEQNNAPALERARPPQANSEDFEHMQFSRTRQTSRGIFSPILKPPRRPPGQPE